MEHSNPQGIDHDKNNIYEAFTGKKAVLSDFILKHLTNVMDKAELDPQGQKVSFVLQTIMEYPGLTDEEKILLAAEYGRGRGIKAGQDEICSSCVIGPASRLLHAFTEKNKLGGKP